MSNGKFITFEGADGSGKSTQASLLAEWLEGECEVEVVLSREPGGAPGAEDIRSLLVEGDPQRWTPITEALLHYAARREHLSQTIMPALNCGKWVISDRFADSTMAYQGYGHKLGRGLVQRLHDIVVGEITPDLTLVLDIQVDVGLRRAASRRGSPDSPLEDRYERMNTEFHQRLREGFLDIARREPLRCVVIDASGDVIAIQQLIRRLLTERLMD